MDVEELENSSIGALANRINFARVRTKPPVFRCLEIIQTPQALICAALNLHQSRVSVLQAGKKPLTIQQQERLCDVARYLLDKCHATFSGEDGMAHDEVEIIIEGSDSTREHIQFQVQFAEQMLMLQMAGINAGESKKGEDP